MNIVRKGIFSFNRSCNYKGPRPNIEAIQYIHVCVNLLRHPSTKSRITHESVAISTSDDNTMTRRQHNHVVKEV